LAIAAWATGIVAALPWAVSLADTARAHAPGVHRVVSAEPQAPGPILATGAGYGFSGAVLGTGDTHHRATGWLMAGASIRPWLALALRLDGRYDRHVDVPGAM